MDHGQGGHADAGDRPVAGHDDEAEAWLAPVWLVDVAGRLIAAYLAQVTGWRGFEEVVPRARGEGAALLVRARDIASLGAALGERISLLVADEERLDSLAALAGAAGAGIVRWDPRVGEKPDLGGPGIIPAILVDPENGGTERAIDALAALGRPAIPLRVHPDGRAISLGTGLAGEIDIPRAGAVAQAGPSLAPPRDALERAHHAESLERHFISAEASAPGEMALPQDRPPRPMALQAYAAALTLLSPLTLPYLLHRMRRGKEDGARLGERRGIAGVERPAGRLVWFHAASVGESLSVLPLIDAMSARGLADRFLVTTGTLTSAALVERRQNGTMIHQFVPLDVPRYARRFLDHWRPSAAIFVESEIWPNLMFEANARRIPLAIVNGRMSARSYARWHRTPSIARATIAAARIVLAQSLEYARRFARLGGRDVRNVGNLKFDCPAPSATDADVETLRSAMAGRPVWLAASTHEGEEEQIAETHIAMRERYPNLLTILVPRHPDRALSIVKTLEDRWLVPARRSVNDEISAKTDIYLADTMGEMGIFFRVARVAFIGGSLVKTGGHNPIEPALVDCVVLHGPHVQNFADTYAALDAVGGAIAVADSGELARHAGELLANEDRRGELVAASRAEIARNEGSLERVLAALTPLVRAPSAGS